MAPQPLNIDPADITVFSGGAYNDYVPLVDTSIIGNITYIAPQVGMDTYWCMHAYGVWMYV